MYNMCDVIKILLPLYLTLSACTGCDFPPDLQSNGSRDWKGRIREQNSGQSWDISFSGDTMRGDARDNLVTSYTRLCLTDQTSQGHNKYIVSHQDDGRESPTYLCVQFVHLSTGVLQLVESEHSPRMSRVRCDDDVMAPVPWLILDMDTILHQRGSCSLTGGFDTTTYDKSTSMSYCSVYTGQTRIESDCSAGDGLTFFFRKQSCVPAGIYMYSTQNTYCLATWRTGAYQFVLLRHDLQPYMWVFRYVHGEEDNFIAYLFTDIVADSDNAIPVTSNYLMLTMSRVPSQNLESLCIDDFNICSDHNDPCNYGDKVAMKLICAATCGTCTARRPNRCFRRHMRGEWLDPDSPSRTGLVINETSLVIDDMPALHCVEWEGSQVSDAEGYTEIMLVSVYDNGCRAKYTCAQYTYPSSSVLFIKLSSPRMWPLIESPTEAVTCHHFTYIPDSSRNPSYRTKLRSRNFRPLLSDTRPVPVECDLSRFAESEVTLADGRQCSVAIDQPVSQDSITLDLSDCGRVNMPQRHMCLEYLQLAPSTDEILVTRSDLSQGQVLCWIFPRGRNNRQQNNFYIVEANHCNEVAVKRIRKGRLEPMASFTRARRSATTHKEVSTLSVDDPNAYGSQEDYINIFHDDTPPVFPTKNTTHQVVDDLPNPIVVGAVIVVFLALQIPCLLKCS